MNEISIGGKRFEILGVIGEGSYGKVYSILKDGRVYALKVIESKVIPGKDKEGIQSLREIDIISRISHPNLMGAEMVVSDYVNDVSRVGIVMEKADKDLYVAMFDTQLNLPFRYYILKQVCFGLRALHESGYLHLDLKPLNILLFPHNQIRITDFGLSVLTETVNGVREKRYPIRLQTIDHRSINVIDGSRDYKASDDVWSLGIVFLSVLSYGRSLFRGIKAKDYTDELVKKVYLEKLSPDHIDGTLEEMGIDKKARPIIKRMLDFNEKTRASLYEVIDFLNFVKRDYVTPKYKNPEIIPARCNDAAYKGFYALFKLGTSLQIRLETFYLAADIYQRSLIYKNKSRSEEGNIRNAIYNATLSMYMAIKMVESYFADVKVLTEISGNLFPPDTLLIGETALVNNFKGVLYPMNLFRASTTENRLLDGFELLRNCFVYPKIDMKQWLKDSLTEQLSQGKFNKYILFSKFIPYTVYYRYFLSNDTDKLYEIDLRENI